jgi:hypothetical protein
MGCITTTGGRRDAPVPADGESSQYGGEVLSRDLHRPELLQKLYERDAAL